MRFSRTNATISKVHRIGESNKKGGDVYMGSGATFKMTGGNITGNTATTNGKAVWVNGTFNWESGTITGNSGTGDAVYIHGGSCSPKPATDAS